MIKLLETNGGEFDGSRAATSDETMEFILTELATTYSDDVDFLRKINKLTFGLISK